MRLRGRPPRLPPLPPAERGACVTPGAGTTSAFDLIRGDSEMPRGQREARGQRGGPATARAGARGQSLCHQAAPSPDPAARAGGCPGSTAEPRRGRAATAGQLPSIVTAAPRRRHFPTGSSADGPGGAGSGRQAPRGAALARAPPYISDAGSCGRGPVTLARGGG